MVKFTPGDYIRERHGHQPSVDDQVKLARILFGHGITPAGNERTRREIRNLLESEGIEFEHKLKTVLNNLEKIDIVESFYPHDGNRWFPISERLDDVIFDRFDEVVKTDQERFIAYMQVSDESGSSGSPAVADGGVTVRSVVANAFNEPPGNVEAHMMQGDMNEQRAKLKTAIDAVEYHPDVENGDDYGRVVWRHMAYRYQVSQWAIDRFS